MPRSGHKQSDLFGGETYAHGEEYDPAVLASMPRLSFSQDEFDALDSDVQEAIHDRDPESAAVIACLHDELEAALNPAHVQAHEEETAGEYAYLFEEWCDSISDRDLLRVIGRFYSAEMQDLADDGFDQETILGALKNYHNYDVEFTNDAHGCVWFQELGDRESSVEMSYLLEHVSNLCKRVPLPDEIEVACGGLDDVNADDITTLQNVASGKKRYGDISFTVSCEGGLGASPNWERVKEDLGEAVPDLVEIDDRSDEERVVHRFKNGSYVLDLKADELAAEGKELGMCVGRKDMPYERMLRRGDAKIFSVRTAAGRPKFTIEAAVEDGKVTSVEQVKGKGNRVPGFDRDMNPKTFKPSEVEMIVEFCEAIGIHPGTVDDLKPALRALQGLKQNPKHGQAGHCSWCTRAAKLRKKYGL